MDEQGLLAGMAKQGGQDGHAGQGGHAGGTDAREEAALDREQAAVRTAGTRLAAAYKALADAEGTLRAAREKEAEYDADDTMVRWQRTAATETAAKAQRALEQAVALVETRAAEEANAKGSTAAAETAIRQAGAAAAAPAAPTPSTVVPAGEEPRLVYGSAEEFLHEQLLPLYNRIVDGKNGKWCRQWYLHPEAVSRVEALWRAWEHLRLDAATGMSVWWRDHADPHMGVLLNPKGPFHACTATTHYTPDPIECDQAPEGWFPNEGEGSGNSSPGAEGQ